MAGTFLSPHVGQVNYKKGKVPTENLKCMAQPVSLKLLRKNRENDKRISRSEEIGSHELIEIAPCICNLVGVPPEIAQGRIQS